jgi:hypothetical protein
MVAPTLTRPEQNSMNSPGKLGTALHRKPRVDQKLAHSPFEQSYRR